MRLLAVTMLIAACGSGGTEKAPPGNLGNGEIAGKITAAKCETAVTCEKGCATDSFESCANLAVMLHNGTGGAARDRARAASVLEKACKGGLDEACNRLAVAHWEGFGVEKAVARAVELFDAACTRQHSLSCINLGSIYRDGDVGISKAPHKAVPYFEKACAINDNCAMLGAAFELGRGVAIDKAKAQALYERACKQGHTDGCRNLGFMLLPKDESHAATLLQQACDGDADDAPYAVACAQLASIYLGDPGREKVEGRTLATKACELGNADGCYLQGAALLNAGVTTEDRDTALALIAKSCTMGSVVGCEQARKRGARRVECHSLRGTALGCDVDFSATVPSQLEATLLDDGRTRVSLDIERYAGVSSKIEYVRDTQRRVYEALLVQDIDLASRSEATRPAALGAVATFLQLLEPEISKEVFIWLTTIGLQAAAAGADQTKTFGHAQVVVSATAGAEGGATTIRIVLSQ